MMRSSQVGGAVGGYLHSLPHPLHSHDRFAEMGVSAVHHLHLGLRRHFDHSRHHPGLQRRSCPTPLSPPGSHLQLVPEQLPQPEHFRLRFFHLFLQPRKHPENDLRAATPEIDAIPEQDQEDGPREQHRVHRVYSDLLLGRPVWLPGLRSRNQGKFALQLRRHASVVFEYR